MSDITVLRAAVAVNDFTMSQLVQQWEAEKDWDQADALERLYDENRIVSLRLKAQLRKARAL